MNTYSGATVILFAIIALFSLIVACTQHVPTTPSPEPTQMQTSTPRPTATSTATPSPTPTPEPTHSPPPESIQEVVERITGQVSGLRGLPIMQDPPTFFISADQMAENVRESIEEEYTQEEADIEAEVFMLLDFIEPGTDLKEVFADLYAGSVVGYYDTDIGEMFVLNDGEDPTPAAKYTLAHELIHALQDQTFDLDVFFPEDEENDDLARAKTALVEGDAVVGSSEYARSFLTRSETRQIYYSGNDGPDLSRIPPFLFKLLAFPYQEGAVFVTAIHSGAGWDSVNNAYSYPPLSTEHILHPEKYLAGEQPVTVTLPDFTASLAPGWENIDEGVLGEFIFATYLENRLTYSRAADAAEFWGGDAYALLRNPDQDKSALVSLSTWDSVEDARDFFGACISYVQAPGQESLGLRTSAEGVRRWDSESRSVLVALDDDRVLLIISESGSAVEAIAAEFPDFPSGP